MPSSPVHKTHASTRARYFQDPCHFKVGLGYKIGETELAMT